jgi:hypothetical protein
VLYTIDTQGIQSLIDLAQAARNKKLEQSRNLTVPMKPEFAQALTNCVNFSCKLFFPITYFRTKG